MFSELWYVLVFVARACGLHVGYAVCQSLPPLILYIFLSSPCLCDDTGCQVLYMYMFTDICIMCVWMC